LLDTRHRHISTLEITKGSINESLAYPRNIFRWKRRWVEIKRMPNIAENSAK
jgi:DNA repair protein RadC